MDVGGAVIIVDAERHDQASAEVPASSSRPKLSPRYRAAVRPCVLAQMAHLMASTSSRNAVHLRKMSRSVEGAHKREG